MFQKLILLFTQGVKSKSLFQFFYKLKNIYLYFKYYNYKNQFKIIYVLTPPSQLSNIGDHAQVVGIKKWLKNNYQGVPVIEFDKDETIHLQWIIKKITLDDDLIFIHSGGNMGDSGLWSERGRRKTIINFPNNKIISLPQTIFFSDSDIGRNELKNSQNIYSTHRNLTIIARDLQSEQYAKSYFKDNKIITCPDFVLYLQDSLLQNDNKREGIVFCLRNDIESALNKEDRNRIISSTNQISKVIDTTIPKLIFRNKRKRELDNILDFIGGSKVMITDRFHGLIFAVLTKTPCIVLATYNHKLVSAFNWFDGINFVKLAKNIDEIPNLITELSGITEKIDKNWASIHFNKLKSHF